MGGNVSSSTTYIISGEYTSDLSPLKLNKFLLQPFEDVVDGVIKEDGTIFILGERYYSNRKIAFIAKYKEGQIMWKKEFANLKLKSLEKSSNGKVMISAQNIIEPYEPNYPQDAIFVMELD